MKMYDLGEKSGQSMAMPEKSMKKEIWYPTISLDAKKVPTIEGLEADSEGTATIKFRVRSKNVRETDKGKDIDVCLDIINIGFGKSDEYKKYMTQNAKGKKNYE